MKLNLIQRKIIEEALASLPASSVNNERRYWRKKIISFMARPSQMKAMELEGRFDMTIDFLDTDLEFSPPEHKHE